MIKAPKVTPSVRVFIPNTLRKKTNGIVVHSMSEKFSGKSASEFLQEIGLSVHAFIHVDGSIELAQKENYKAYHAGKSEWKG
jgi:N-acetyl-anhydromuramyl-L-alanine amidase AmpD